LRKLLGNDIIDNISQTDIRKLKLKLKQNKWNTKEITNDIMMKYPKLKKNKKRKNKIVEPHQTKKQKINNVTDSSDEDYVYNSSDDYDYSDGFVVRDDYNSDNEILDIYENKMIDIKKAYNKSIINMNDIMKSEFNNNDTLWFYRNIKRQSQLEGKDKYDLEDTIRRRYNLLCNLQENNMYESFNRDVEQDISKTILNSKHSIVVKKILLNRMLNAIEESNEEYQKALTWMNTILSLPTETKCNNININIKITNLYNNLKKHLYGMETIIQQILQAVCVILTDPENRGYVLTLVGPPGVGKTTISSLISEAIGMGFGQVSCGSINDRATIMGHSSTYIGSKPGMITQIQINSGQLDNVILLDEMDKLTDSKITPILLQILDKTQNSRFKDEFCPEVYVDLSKVMFIISVNDVSLFDSALRDRLKIINIDGYDMKTKIHICSKHIIPKVMKRTGIKIKISKTVIKECIEKVSPNISGVRELERFFSDIYEKLLLIKSFDNYSNIKKIYKLNNNFDIDNIKYLSMDTINNFNL
jgi:ATP-dependent Lon protease